MKSPTRKKDVNPITPGPRKRDLKPRAPKPRLPTNIGGRITSVVCHPENPDCIWAGAAAGGVWQSSDAGLTWRSLWSKQDSLNIGSLAIDPANPDVIYCGTGEANLSADSYAGVGIYKTADGGATWKLLASAADLGIPTRIGVIAIDPRDSMHLLIGGVGANESSPKPEDFGGMFVSRDGGVSWRRETFISTKNYWCHAIVFHPTKRDVIFATFTEQGAKNGIWLSDDGGEHWRQLSQGLPAPENFGRTSLAISPLNPDVIYAFAQNTLSDRSDLLLGVFRSADGGQGWREIGGRHFRAEGQISYGNTIAVHPKHPNHVLCGGVDLHLTTNGGKTWTRATRWDLKRGSIHYAHADHHHLLMPLADPGRVYDTNDGGIDVSENGGRTWSSRSKGLAVTMYYDMDVSQSNGRMIPPTRRIYTPPITTWAFSAGAMGEAGMCRRQLQRAKQMPPGWFTSQWIRIIRTRCSPDLRVSGALKTTAKSGGRFRQSSTAAQFR